MDGEEVRLNNHGHVIFHTFDREERVIATLDDDPITVMDSVDNCIQMIPFVGPRSTFDTLEHTPTSGAATSLAIIGNDSHVKNEQDGQADGADGKDYNDRNDADIIDVNYGVKYKDDGVIYTSIVYDADDIYDAHCNSDIHQAAVQKESRLLEYLQTNA